MSVCDAHKGLEDGIERIESKLDKILLKLNDTDKRVDKIYTIVGFMGFLGTVALATVAFLKNIKGMIGI